jgi:hypothetical protein
MRIRETVYRSTIEGAKETPPWASESQTPENSEFI